MNILQIAYSRNLVTSVTRYDNNHVEVCRVSPTGRETVLRSHDFSTEQGAMLYFDIQKDLI